MAGVNLAKATDLLDERYGLGEGLGGMILLSVCPGATRRSAEGRHLVPYQVESHPSGPLTDDPFSSTPINWRPSSAGCDTTAVRTPPHRCGLLPAAAAAWAKAAARRSA